MMMRWWVRIGLHESNKPSRTACIIGSSSLWFRGFNPFGSTVVKGSWIRRLNMRHYHYNFDSKECFPDKDWLQI